MCKSFTRPDGSTKYNAEPDFKFVVIERFLSAENEFFLRDGILLNAYFWLNVSGKVMKRPLAWTRAMWWLKIYL